jgi:CBS domain-containing protein
MSDNLVKATDIMSSPAITVGPETPIAQIATLLSRHRISAVPVVEAGRLVGLVSEADLLHRYEIGTDASARAPSGWRWLLGRDSTPAEYTKSHAVRARGVMTRDVIAIGADAPIDEIVALLDKRNVKRVPVVRGAEVIGIVSRADVVRAVARQAQAPAEPALSDEAIEEQLTAELERHHWWRTPYSSVRVENGIVHYSGIIDSPDEQAWRDAARVAAESLAGVRAVEDHRFTMYDIPSMV